MIVIEYSHIFLFLEKEVSYENNNIFLSDFLCKNKGEKKLTIHEGAEIIMENQILNSIGIF